MKLALLDADSCVYALAGTSKPLLGRLARRKPGSVAISAITFSEVALGTVKGLPLPPDELERFLRHVVLLPYDEAAARAYARLPFRRARFDRLLAAHALSIGATIVTNNESDFADIPGLAVENWTLPPEPIA